MSDYTIQLRHIGNVGGGGGFEIHGFGGVVPWTTMETDTMTPMRLWTDFWVHDSTLENDVRDRAGNIMETASGQLDGTPTLGIWRHLPKMDDVVPLPFFQVRGSSRTWNRIRNHFNQKYW